MFIASMPCVGEVGRVALERVARSARVAASARASRRAVSLAEPRRHADAAVSTATAGRGRRAARATLERSRRPTPAILQVDRELVVAAELRVEVGEAGHASPARRSAGVAVHADPPGDAPRRPSAASWTSTTSPSAESQASVSSPRAPRSRAWRNAGIVFSGCIGPGAPVGERDRAPRPWVGLPERGERQASPALPLKGATSRADTCAWRPSRRNARAAGPSGSGPADLTVRVCADDDGRGAYRFRCPSLPRAPCSTTRAPAICALLVSRRRRREVVAASRPSSRAPDRPAAHARRPARLPPPAQARRLGRSSLADR